MITLEMAIAKIKKLPAEQRNEVIKFVEFLEFKLDNIEQSQEQTELEEKEVVVICFDHTKISAQELEKLIKIYNQQVLMARNYVILEDHPDAVELVNGVHMNFGHCGLLVIQKLDKLTTASEQLKSKGYYDTWSQSELDQVVTWRNP